MIQGTSNLPINAEDFPVFIIGAGQMGAGIAQVSAASGFPTTLFDVANEALSDAEIRIGKNFERDVRRNRLSAVDARQALNRITFAKSLDGIANCTLVIEAATERESTKIEILSLVDSFANDRTIIATNTSSLSVTRLGAMLKAPDRFMGLHFMNPVPAMKLVELIRSFSTSSETFATLAQFSKMLGKDTVVSEDYPAFIINRILIPMINEAVYTLYEGVGDINSIDLGLRLGANHPLGPFQLADLIGLDTCLSIMNTLNNGLADSKYRPCPLLVKYVEAGWLGRKTGRGFYDYEKDVPVPTR